MRLSSKIFKHLFLGLAVMLIFVAGTMSFAFRTNIGFFKSQTKSILNLLAGDIGGAGNIDGTGDQARLDRPRGMVLDGSGFLYVGMRNEYYPYSGSIEGALIKKINTTTGQTTVFAGDYTQGAVNASVLSASFGSGTLSLARNTSTGDIYVADAANHLIRKISGGVVSTFAGAGTAGFANGNGTSAVFNGPSGLAYDTASTTLYVADSGNHSLRSIDSSGNVTTLAGDYLDPNHVNGSAAASRFNFPKGLTLHGSSTLYIADSGNHAIRKYLLGSMTSTTFAGTTSAGVVDGTASSARFNSPQDVTIDNSSGHLFVADTGNHLIRKIDQTQNVTRYVGTGETLGTGTIGLSASFKSPSGVLFNNSAGVLYVADTGNHRVRSVDSSKIVTNLSGRAPLILYGPEFSNMYGIVIDSGGNYFVADSGNHLIRKITPNGATSTFAGAAFISGFIDGTGADARFNSPRGLAIDSSDNIYVADYYNESIRKITPAGVVTTFAGNGSQGWNDAIGVLAQFNRPHGIGIDPSNNLYVADELNNVIRKIDTFAMVTTLAGSGVAGLTNGTGAVAQFYAPRSVIYEPTTSRLYVSDSGNNAIRGLTTTGSASTLAGGAYGTADGVGVAAQFNYPGGLATDGSGVLYVPDQNSHTIREVRVLTSSVTTPWGTAGTYGFYDGYGSSAIFNQPTAAVYNPLDSKVYITDYFNSDVRSIDTASNYVGTYAGYGFPGGYSDGNIFTGGTLDTIRFNGPVTLAADAAGNIYSADYSASIIRKITPAGVVTVLAGSILAGYADGTGTEAKFSQPTAIAVTPSGTVYVSDAGNFRIRMITPAGVVSTVAGNGTSGFLNGNGTSAQFGYLGGLVLHGTGTLYIADSGNSIIRKMITTGAKAVTTFVGNQGSFYCADATGTAAVFNYPQGLTIGNGTLYIADTYNHSVRAARISSGAVTTIAGPCGWPPGFDDGTGSSARFDAPAGVEYNASSNVFYVLDQYNRLIRKMTIAGQVSTVVGTYPFAGVQLSPSVGILDVPVGMTLSQGTLYIYSGQSIVHTPAP